MKLNLFKVTALLLLFTFSINAESEKYRKYQDIYPQLGFPLDNAEGEVANISNFSYTKDVATFNFIDGEMHLLRFADGRPTTAIFIGQGEAKISIPNSVEQNSLYEISKKRNVDETFKVCLIRFADDLDLKLREKFTFKKEKLDWRDYNKARQAQSELFFRPVIYHEVDNHWQLLQSVFERNNDGYFWIDFNRYNFCYDPNRPQQVRISYEQEGGDQVITEAAIFQKKENNNYGNYQLSNISYPSRILENNSEITIGGLDGKQISICKSNLKILVEADSTQFLSVFLHYNLKLDSLQINGNAGEYHRRKDFRQICLILPEFSKQDDTLDVTLWYHGKHFDNPLPSVENPSPSVNSFTFFIPKDFNLIAYGKNGSEKFDKRLKKIKATPEKPSRKYYYQALPSGYDTVVATTSIGIEINFLKSKAITKKEDCFIPHKVYQSSVLAAFEYYSSNFGGPQGTFSEFVLPFGYELSMPGMIKVPQIACVRDDYIQALGGFDMLAGKSVALQWFGELTNNQTMRESWLSYALPEYMMMLYLEDHLDGGEFFSNLLIKRDSLYTIEERNFFVPLAIENRVSQKIPYETIKTSKGAWVFHMLRMLMIDTDDLSEKKFKKFMQEVIFRFNSKPYTNKWFKEIAEKHYGQPLGWFFDQWLFDSQLPTFDVKQKIYSSNGEFFVDFDIQTKNVSKNFKAPTIMSIQFENENIFIRENLEYGNNSYKYGPFKTKPKKLSFNEFFSVLSRDKIKEL